MLRNIIEYLRKESSISTIDLTLDVCSLSMYYAYIKGYKQLSQEKLIIIKDRLGADQLSDLEVDEYNQELDEYGNYLCNMSYDVKNLLKYFDILQDYKVQMLLDERLIVKYLIVMIQFLIILERYEDFKKFLHLFSLVTEYLDKEQMIYYYACATYEREISYDELLGRLYRIEKILSSLSCESKYYGFVYLTLGKMYLRTHKHYHSRYFINQAIEYYRKRDCFCGIVSSKNVYALNLIVSNQVEEALNELAINIQRAKGLNYLEEIKTSKTYQLICYGLLNRVDEVVGHYQEIIDIFQKGSMPADYFRLLCIIGIFDKFKLRNEVQGLLKSFQPRLPEPAHSIYREFLRAYSSEDEEEKRILFEKILDNYQDAYYGFDWKNSIYSWLIKHYESTRCYKKIAEISKKYIDHLKKYIH